MLKPICFLNNNETSLKCAISDKNIIKKSEINCAKNLLMPDFYTKTNLNFSGKNNASHIQKRNFLQKKKKIFHRLENFNTSVVQKFLINHNLNNENAEIAELLSRKRKNIQYLPKILKHTIQNTAPIIKELCAVEKNNAKNVLFYCTLLNKKNEQFAQKLYEDGRFEAKEICSAAENYSPEKEAFAHEMLENERFMKSIYAKEVFGVILFCLNDKNESFIRNLLNDKTCPINSIPQILFNQS